MLQLNSFVQRLTEQNRQFISEQNYAISLYEKAGELTNAAVETRIKSHILAGLRGHSKLASLSRMHEKIISRALDSVKQMETRPKGFGLFLQFNAAQLEKEPAQAKTNNQNLFSELISFYNSPETHVYVGKIFDLSPLFRMIRKTNLAIVCQIENHQTSIYTIKGSSFEKAAELKNRHNEPTDNEYIEAYKPSPTGAVHHGTGSENVARRQISANKVFLSEVGAEIKKLLKKDNIWKNAVFYCSKDFQPYIKEWSDKLFKQKISYSPIVINKLMSTDKQLQENSLEVIEEHVKDSIKKQFLEDKEKYTFFAVGWKDVTDAVREHRVERLYLRPDVRRLGFILDQASPYSYPIRNAKRVNNIIPWIVQEVIASKGDIITAQVIKELNPEPIAAKMRFVH